MTFVLSVFFFQEITTGQAVDVVADIQWAIQVLTTNPANFDDVMSSLTALPLLAENRIDDIVLDAIVDEIFNNVCYWYLII